MKVDQSFLINSDFIYSFIDCFFFYYFQAERLRKEEADAHRKAEDEAKKKIALSNMGSGYSSILQRVSDPPSPWWGWWCGGGAAWSL